MAFIVVCLVLIFIVRIIFSLIIRGLNASLRLISLSNPQAANRIQHILLVAKDIISASIALVILYAIVSAIF